MDFRHLAALIEGTPDADALEAVSVALRAWWSLGIPLARAFSLPSNAQAQRLRARDYWLQEAARLMPSDLGPWQRAQALHEAIRGFAGHEWPIWNSQARPPAHADELHTCLWRAFRAGKMPGTARRLRQILG